MCVCVRTYIYIYIYMLKYLSVQPKAVESYSLGERLAPLLIVSAASVSLPCSLFPLGNWVKQSFKCLLFPWQLSEGL